MYVLYSQWVDGIIDGNNNSRIYAVLYCSWREEVYGEDEDSSLLLLSVFGQYSYWVDRIIDGNNNSCIYAVLYCSWKEEDVRGR